MIRANSRMSSPWLLSSRLDCVTHNSMMLCSRKMRSDRKSTRLNSSHLGISYAVFCLKKKNIGYAGSPEQAVPHLNNAQILYGWGFPIDLLRKMPKLRWVQKRGAGVDDVVGQCACAPYVLLTMTDGRLISSRMVEYVLCVVFDRTQKMHLARTQQAERRWAYYDTRSIRQCTFFFNDPATTEIYTLSLHDALPI